MSNKVILFLLIFSQPIFGGPFFQIERFSGQCPEYKNPVAYFTDIHFNYVEKIQYTYAKLKVTKDFDHIKGGFQMTLSGMRCNSNEALDSCEPYPDMRFGSVCEILKAKNQFWTPFVESFSPKIECPFKKGVYNLMNATLDANPVVNPLLGRRVWKTKILITARGAEINTNEALCFMIHGQGRSN